jgi:hypothetical protein
MLDLTLLINATMILESPLFHINHSYAGVHVLRHDRVSYCTSVWVAVCSLSLSLFKKCDSNFTASASRTSV